MGTYTKFRGPLKGTKKLGLATLFLFAFLMESCARTTVRNEGALPSAASEKVETQEFHTPQDNLKLKAKITELSQRVDELDEKLSVMTDKLEQAKSTLSTYRRTKTRTPIQSETVISDKGAELKNVSIHSMPSVSDPELGFTNDESIQIYRQAKILFDGGKYSEAILAFVEFIREFPVHPFASSAQYYIGESYYQKSEIKLAKEEFERVLSRHSISNRVPEALKRISEIEERLQRKSEAQKYRQILLSLFPQSPAAFKLSKNKKLTRTPDGEGSDTDSETTSEKNIPPTAPMPSTQKI